MHRSKTPVTQVLPRSFSLQRQQLISLTIMRCLLWAGLGFVFSMSLALVSGRGAGAAPGTDTCTAPPAPHAHGELVFRSWGGFERQHCEGERAVNLLSRAGSSCPSLGEHDLDLGQHLSSSSCGENPYFAWLPTLLGGPCERSSGSFSTTSKADCRG